MTTRAATTDRAAGARDTATGYVGPMRSERKAAGGGNLGLPAPVRVGSTTDYEEKGCHDRSAPPSDPSAGPAARGASADLDDSVYNRLLKERIIFLGSEVTDQVANRICAQLLLLAAEDPDRDIYLWINSPGGSVYSGMAIYDTMQFIANDVSTVAMGMAASMGQLLLCAGTRASGTPCRTRGS